MHGNRVFQTRQNQVNILGVDLESGQLNSMSRGFPMFESQLKTGPETFKKSLLNLESTESPVNYNFFGVQQQMSGQHPGMLQSLTRQQLGFGDMQLLQQQAMLKQMQELHRQQELQRQIQEARAHNSVNQVNALSYEATGKHSTALINGIPVHGTLNYSRPSEFMTANSKWVQQGVPPDMLGPSSGHMISPQHSEEQYIKGLGHKQVDQSLYGVPLASSHRQSSPYSQIETDRSVVQQMPACDNSFLNNQYAGLPEQASKQDASLTYRQEYQVKNMIGSAASQVSGSEINLENLQQAVNPCENTPMQGSYGRQEPVGFSETPQAKEMMAANPSQNVATLDPTEEKILFGSDDNIWDVFGKSAGMGMGGFNKLEGTDLSFPSLTSGTWSALMQSAVAETSSGDVGQQDEWSGLSFCSTENTGNYQPMGVNDSNSLQPVWPEKSSHATMLNGPSFVLGSGGDACTSYNSVVMNQQPVTKDKHGQNEGLQATSTQRSMQQHLSEARWLDQKFPQKDLSEGSNIYGTGKVGGASGMNSVGSPIEMNHAESAVKSHNREDASMGNISSVPISKDAGASTGSKQQLQHGGNPNLWKHVDSRVSMMPNDFQSHSEARRQLIDFPGNNDSGRRVAPENHEVDESHKKENTSESFHSSVSQHVPFGVGLREKVLLHAGDSRDSQSFGLQLAPPSQKLLNNYQASSSLSSLQPVNSTNSTQLPPVASVLSSSMTSPYNNIQEKNSAGFNSDFPSPRNHVHGAGGQGITHQSPYNPSNRQSKQMDPSYERGHNLAITSGPHVFGSVQENDLASLTLPFQRSSSNQVYARDLTQKLPLLEPPSASQPSDAVHLSQKGSPSNSLPNLLFHDPIQQYSSGVHASDNYPGTNDDEEQSIKESIQHQVSAEADYVKKTDESQGTVNQSDASSFNATPTEQDIEAFGRSLRSNNNEPSMFLRNQMQALRNAEAEPGNRSVKRFKGPDGSQQSFRYDAMTRDASMKVPSNPADLRTHFSSKPGDNLNTSAAMNDMCLFRQSNSQSLPSSNSPAYVRGYRPQISPQMAPSWFDQYGTFKIGQTVPTYASQNSLAVETVEHPLAVSRISENSLASSSPEKVNSAADACKHENIQHSSDPMTIVNDHLSSPQVTNETDTTGASKHSIITPKLLPWFREVTQASQRFWNISVAEIEWAQATNRLSEKIEMDDDLMQNGAPLVRSKRRLVLTTQLMQQLLRPPAASVCSADVDRQFENVIYFIARLALGDACSSASFSGKGPLSRDGGNIPSEKVRELGRICDLDLSKVAEDLIVRAKKLEDDLLRLEKGTSFLDLRLGFHDLEKFSILNRFAVFHTRGQDGAQRYVTPVPMPKNLPENAQCFSL